MRCTARSFAAAALLFACILRVAQGETLSTDEPAREFSILAQPLSSALLEFSKQSDLIVTVPGDLVQGKAAPEIRGALVPMVALEKLLMGSGLKASRTASGGIVIGQASVTR